MKLCIVLLSLAAIAFADAWQPVNIFCACPPLPPICASNGVTYAGECNMNCAQHWIEEKIFVVHDGPCIQPPLFRKNAV